MKKIKTKAQIGDRVRVVKNYSKSHNNSIGRIGILTRITDSEMWVDFPDGSGGLMDEVVLHKEDPYSARKNVLLQYKASEMPLEVALNELERIDISLES